ncbi:alpha/beta hydrolase family protein [Pyxidicoccus sp. 3LFB2]
MNTDLRSGTQPSQDRRPPAVGTLQRQWAQWGQRRRAVELPTPTGPLAVGRSALDVVAPERKEPYARRPARELSVWLWYPASPEPGARAGAYLPGAWRRAGHFWGFPSKRVRAHAIPDAPVADAQAPHPVLLFSPAGFPPPFYTALFEELASHGYVVAAVSHTYEMLPVSVFADGRVRWFRPSSVGGALSVSRGPQQEDVRKRAAVVEVKADDLRSVVARLSAEPGRFAGKLDSDRLGAMGHSMGGNAAAEWCARDGRCRAVAILDGGLWTAVAHGGVKRPVLEVFGEHPEYTQPCDESVRRGMFSSEDYCRADQRHVLRGWQRLYAEARPGYSFQIHGAGHASFTDCGLLPLRNWSPAGQAMGTITGDRMWRVLGGCLRAFFDRHVKGVPAPLLDDPAHEYPEVVSAAPEVLFSMRTETPPVPLSP